jgi:protocatechuate 3,4-dioxygenase beta subunit
MDVGSSGGLPSAVTDREGRYRLTSAAFPGRRRLCAAKESAGYPNTHGLLFVSGKENMPEVSLTAGGHLENVDIRLGPPDGILEGSVIDLRTGAPIPKARITLHRSDPESMYATSLPPDSHFVFALPPVPIEITVEAPDYKPWEYRNPQSLAKGLVLSNSDHRVIAVELRPN